MYKKIIQELEPHYKKDSHTTQHLYDAFISKLKTSCKLTITFDAEVIDQLMKYIQECNKRNPSSIQFHKKLAFTETLLQGLQKNKFVDKRGANSLKQILSKFLNNPIRKLQQLKSVVKSSESQMDFRYDFFPTVSKEFKDTTNEQEELVSNQEWVKKQYNEFWNKTINEKYPKDLIVFYYSIFEKFQKKTQILDSHLIKKLEDIVGDKIGTSQEQIQLNSYLLQMAQNNSIDNQMDLKRKLNQQYEFLGDILKKFSGLNIFKNDLKLNLRLHKFGSLISGFAGADSDLDVTILTDCYVNEQVFLGHLADFMEMQLKDSQRRTGKRYKVEFIPSAKVPLITLVISQRKATSMKIDILVNNILGVINSKLLYIYSRVRWVRQLGILVKIWAKSANIISKNQLSSYAIILMLIHYLIKKDKVKLLLDARGRSNDAPHFIYKRMKSQSQEQFKVYYKFKSNPQDVSQQNRVNIADLMKGFFKYYSIVGQHWLLAQQDQIISVDGTNDKKFQPDYIFTIKDPFDEPHNPGRSKITDKNWVLQKFLDAYQRFLSNDTSKIQGLFVIKK